MLDTRAWFRDYPWLPYVAPMAAFMLLTALEGQVLGEYRPDKSIDYSYNYLYYYTIKIIIVSMVSAVCSGAWHRELLPLPGALRTAAAAGLGVAVAAAWIALDPHYPRIGLLGKRTAFDPTALAGAGRLAFFVARLYGLVLVVPLIEEVFWRSFLVRWVADPDFQRVPIGKVTPLAAAVTSVLFALGHPEWLPALLTGFAWVGLLAWTRSVSACWISHMVANAALGAYVIGTQRWQFW
jgi:hypothetical protein